MYAIRVETLEKPVRLLTLLGDMVTGHTFGGWRSFLLYSFCYFLGSEVVSSFDCRVGFPISSTWPFLVEASLKAINPAALATNGQIAVKG